MGVRRIPFPLLCGLACALAWGQSAEKAKRLAPFIPSPPPVVDKLLEAAAVKPGETVYDLGCGDGRVLVAAVQKFHARAVGVEISSELVKKANENLRNHGVADRATVVHGSLLDVDLSPADVVILYLLTDANELIRPKLERSLKPGARVVSHDFKVPGWQPVRVEKVGAFGREHAVYVYQMPPQKK